MDAEQKLRSSVRSHRGLRLLEPSGALILIPDLLRGLVFAPKFQFFPAKPASGTSENRGGRLCLRSAGGRTVASSARDVNLSLSETITSYFGAKPRLSLHSAGTLGLICGSGTPCPPTSASCQDTDIYGPGVTRPEDTVDFKHKRTTLEKKKIRGKIGGLVFGRHGAVSFYTFGPKRGV